MDVDGGVGGGDDYDVYRVSIGIFEKSYWKLQTSDLNVYSHPIGMLKQSTDILKTVDDDVSDDCNYYDYGGKREQRQYTRTQQPTQTSVQ